MFSNLWTVCIAGHSFSISFYIKRKGSFSCGCAVFQNSSHFFSSSCSFLFHRFCLNTGQGTMFPCGTFLVINLIPVYVRRLMGRFWPTFRPDEYIRKMEWKWAEEQQLRSTWVNVCSKAVTSFNIPVTAVPQSKLLTACQTHKKSHHLHPNVHSLFKVRDVFLLMQYVMQFIRHK